uniref:PAT complex subunit Asterix n=1 Tax=Pelodiscus sinensis TaxID=13735 RepID=K7FLK6_PELSI
VQAANHGEQPHAGRPHSRLHEPAGDDFQHVRLNAEGEQERNERRWVLPRVTGAELTLPSLCPDALCRYKPPTTENNPTLEDPTPDYMNLLGMIFSMCGLMLKLKWCAWIAVYCSFISFANSRSSEDTKQMMSSFMLSISAVVMSYLQNPQPMSPPCRCL